MTMIGKIGWYMAKETLGLCPLRVFCKRYSRISIAWLSPVVIELVKDSSWDELGTSVMHGSPRGTGEEIHIPICWLIPSKTCHLALREVAFIHKEYSIEFNLLKASSDFRRSRRRATTFAGSTLTCSRHALCTHPTLQPQVIE